MALIPSGKFTLGGLVTGPDGTGTAQEEREVQLDSFWMGVHEVTWDAYNLFAKKEYDSDASNWKEGAYKADAISRPSPPYTDMSFGMGKAGGYPMVSMTQQAALRYCQWLYHKTGAFYRLPTEAEWEYACRAGSNTTFFFGENPSLLDEYAWYDQNSGEKINIVGQKKPNAWGLYDMLGNVAEWTLDQYVANYFDGEPETLVNPWKKPVRRHSRTVKGGGYDDLPEMMQKNARLKSEARWQIRDPQIPKSIWWNTDSPFVGFRLVRPLKPMTAAEVEAFFNEAIID